MDSGASAQAGGGEVGLERRNGLGEALEHMTAALEILDRSMVSADIGARLDEVVHRLREEINRIK